jgi:nicotinate phosphoribosyltransferase
MQGAKIDSFGVGERLITSRSEPVFGGVYKLVAVESGNEIVPRIKLSENVAKITNPGFKSLYRLFTKEGKAIADVITEYGEEIDNTKPYSIFDPNHTWKKKTLTDFEVKPLLIQIFDKGKCVYNSPDLKTIQKYCKEQIDTLWDEVKRFENPHVYYVDLSKKLWETKQKLLEIFG